MNTMSTPTTIPPVVRSPFMQHPSAFIAAATDPANGPTPAEALLAATKRMEAVAYARGFDAALSRLELLAAIAPESVTKAQLVDLLKSEVSACVAEWAARHGLSSQTADMGKASDGQAAALRAAEMIIGEIIRDEVNPKDECEKWMRAYGTNGAESIAR